MERGRGGERSRDGHEPPPACLCHQGPVTYLGVLGVRCHLSLPFVLGTGGNLWGAAQMPSQSCSSEGGRGFPPSPALPRFPKLPRGGWERDTPLPGNAGWLESLKVCGDAKEVAAETAASSGTPPHAGDSPTCQPQPGCHQSILSALQAGGDTGGAVPACPAW